MFKALTLLALIAIPAFADLSTSASCDIRSYLGTFIYGNAASGTSNTTLSCDESFLDPLGPSGFSLSGADTGAGYGQLSASASANIYGDPFATAYSYAQASFSDKLTILGGSGIGYADFSFTGGIDTRFSYSTFDGMSAEELLGYVSTFGAYSDSFNVTISYQFAFGVPFIFSGSVDSEAFYIQKEPLTNTGVSADLSDIQVFDSNHQPLPSFEYTSASGTIYPGGVYVPEPSTLLLLGSAICCLLVGLRRVATPKYPHQP